MIGLYIPQFEELSFRRTLMSDPATMSYNQKWGGTIDFPRERWREWYDFWIVGHENLRFYRYLQNSDTSEFVGETAYHFDRERNAYTADIIVYSKHRRKGFGTQGLRLLCAAAKENGVKTLYDDIAVDNPSISLFIKNGFVEEYRTDEYIMMKKNLS